ncbi:MAG TPA: hypothetical protein PKA84_18820, partial [Rubrivivax sp.]|nr:hypothetical protein [Rubrivivax sp.]
QSMCVPRASCVIADSIFAPLLEMPRQRSQASIVHHHAVHVYRLTVTKHHPHAAIRGDDGSPFGAIDSRNPDNPFGASPART